LCCHRTRVSQAGRALVLSRNRPLSQALGAFPGRLSVRLSVRQSRGKPVYPSARSVSAAREPAIRRSRASWTRSSTVRGELFQEGHSRGERSEVPGTGLEPVRPRGAARFKLAVSAFHHPGRPWAPRRRSEPIGVRPPNCRRANRCCLILLTSEGASDHGTRHPHLPIALRGTPGRARGMTEFHRLNKDAPPVLCTCPDQGPPSSPGMTPSGAVPPKSAPGTRTATDYTARCGHHDGRRPATMSTR